MGQKQSKIFSNLSDFKSKSTITLSDYITKAKTGDLILI